MATFKDGTQAKILRNNPLLDRWTLDRPFGKHKKQIPSQKANKYLLDVCWTWEETSMKSTASDMGSQIKSLRDETGQKCGIGQTA